MKLIRSKAKTPLTKKRDEWLAPGKFAPRFALDNFPDSEREGIEHIQNLLANLHTRLIDFNAAIWLARRASGSRPVLGKRRRFSLVSAPLQRRHAIVSVVATARAEAAPTKSHALDVESLKVTASI